MSVHLGGLAAATLPGIGGQSGIGPASTLHARIASAVCPGVAPDCHPPTPTEQQRAGSSAASPGTNSIKPDRVGAKAATTTGNLAELAHANIQGAHFLPGTALDRPPLPITAPNPRKYLSGSDVASLPFHLRLFVDADGQVIDVQVLQPIAVDEANLRPVKDMFRATLFVPGRIKGLDVPSYLDIEVLLQDLTTLQAASPAPTRTESVPVPVGAVTRR